ncbi:hypothetical protein [Sphingomonas quercus]|uniref:Uncharacterized protein n=1 Tax=Sphingomonas quercus TaxID=2842451 RepID=A0ABS6BDY3_9SPHN|nr:hypothetical protein [Sphingomonas quercus]MBU3076530.1 hypothetical protein [Sphingomonas quercus]
MRGLFCLTLAIGLATTPALAADQFDLLCKGQQKFTPDGAATPIEAHYRVDVAAGSYCRDQCIGIDKLAGAAPGKIAFKAHAKANEQDELVDESYEPATGKWVDLYAGPYPPGEYAATEGKCEAATFSGFPKK